MNIIFVEYMPRFMTYIPMNMTDEIAATEDLQSKGYKVLGYMPSEFIEGAENKNGFYMITKMEIPSWFEFKNNFIWKKVDNIKLITKGGNTMTSTLLTINNAPIKVEIPDIAEAYMAELNLTRNEVFAIIMGIGDKLLTFKPGQRFNCLSKDKLVFMTCAVSEEEGQPVITVLVCSSSEFLFTM